MQLFCWQKSIYGNTEHNCQSCHNGAFQFDSSQNVTLNWVNTNIFAHFTTGINFANEVTGLRWDPSSRVTKMSHFSKIFIALSSFRFDRKKNSSRWTSPLSLTASFLFFFFGLIDNCYNYKQSIFGSSHWPSPSFDTFPWVSECESKFYRVLTQSASENSTK